MPQLSAHDAAFLYSETAHANANLTLVHIYDPSTLPGGRLRFKTLLAHVASRLDHLPRLRQRLQRVPLDLDHPYWVDDPHFDLEYHVRHLALPQPGDWRQFCIQAARIHARALDLQRPLWELYVIEGLDRLDGLPRGSFALLAKTHHALADVEGGSELTRLLHDLTPDPPPAPPPAPWFPRPAPRGTRMLWRGAWHGLGAAATLAPPLARALRRGAPAALTLAGDLLRRDHRLPPTRFNAAISPHRVFETRRFDLADFRRIRDAVPGATVHDAVLAVCGGALRRYLQAHGELPAASLVAMAPVYAQPAATAAPVLSLTRIALGTDGADPLQRLAAIGAATQSSQAMAGAIGARELTEVGHHAPAATLALAAKLLARATASLGRRAPLAHCTVTNVPGPTVPLFLCGARLAYYSAIMPVADGMGLVFAVTSHEGRLIVSPTSCRELMPDPAFFAQCLRDSFQETLAAAQAGPRQGAARRRAAAAAGPAATGDAAAVRPKPAPRRRAATSARPVPTNPVA